MLVVFLLYLMMLALHWELGGMPLLLCCSFAPIAIVQSSMPVKSEQIRWMQ